METTHTDANGIATAFSTYDDYTWEASDGTKFRAGWPFFPTPCCGAAASINDGPMYCKACYEEVDDIHGAMPKEPFTPITTEGSSV